MKLHLIKDFKEICRLRLDSNFLNETFEKAISFCGSKKELAFKFNTDWNNLYRYMTSRKTLPAAILEKLLQLLNKDFTFIYGYIIDIRFNCGLPFKVLDQKLEVNFDTKEGAKVIGALLGDGYNKSNYKGAGYVNKNPILRSEFLENLNKLFKCIKLRDYSKPYNGKILQLPFFFSYVFDKAGVPCGRKVLLNSGVPNWLLKSNRGEVISAYLQQIFDDEGHVAIERAVIDLPQSIDVTDGKRVPKQLIDIEYLLGKIDIKGNTPYNIGTYEVKIGNKKYIRKRFVLTITSYLEIQKFANKVGFLSTEKQSRLDKIISMPVVIQRKNKQIEVDVLDVCRNLEFDGEPITSNSLSKKLDIAESYAQKLLKKLTKSGKLTKTRSASIIHRTNGDILRRTHAEFVIEGERNAV